MIGKVKQTGIRDDILYASGVKVAGEVTTTSLGIMKDVIPGHHLETEKPYLQAQVKLLFFKI